MVNDTNHTKPYKTYEECQKNLPDLAFIFDNVKNKIKHNKLEKRLPPFNKTIAGVNFRGGGRFRRGSEDVKIHPDVAPQEDDIIIDRQRAGIFSGTSLDLMLRSREIGQLAIFGISTSGQVLSAVRWGVVLDYDQYVLEDCCADKDEEVHRMLMSKVLSMHSKVISSEDFLAAIK